MTNSWTSRPSDSGDSPVPVAESTSTIIGTITSGQPSRIRLSVPSKSNEHVPRRLSRRGRHDGRDDLDVRAGQKPRRPAGLDHAAIVFFVIAGAHPPPRSILANLTCRRPKDKHRRAAQTEFLRRRAAGRYASDSLACNSCWGVSAGGAPGSTTAAACLW